MPVKLESGDRKILIAAGILLVGFVLAGFIFYPASARYTPGFPSSYSASSGGGKAAYLLLQQLSFRVKRWSGPPEELPALAPGARIVLIIAHPMLDPSTEELYAVQSFAARGGWVLTTGRIGARLIGGTVKNVHPGFTTWHRFSAEAPSPLTLGAPEILLNGNVRWRSLLPRQQRYYGDRNGAAVVSYKIGLGRVVWWASAAPLTNYGLTQDSNLMLFLNSIGMANPAKQPHNTLVLWDEYFHGQTKTLAAYFAATPAPWALLQIAVVFAVALIAFGRRSGPVRSLAKAGARFSPLEFVDALASLYRRKHDAAGALEIASERLKSRLIRRWGLPAFSREFGTAARAGRAPWGEEESHMLQILQECERGISDANLTERRALRLYQELHDCAARLGLIASADPKPWQKGD